MILAIEADENESIPQGNSKIIPKKPKMDERADIYFRLLLFQPHLFLGALYLNRPRVWTKIRRGLFQSEKSLSPSSFSATASSLIKCYDLKYTAINCDYRLITQYKSKYRIMANDI